MDSFRILGVDPGASPAEIKRAYRRLAMVWHPDRNTHPEATERFKEIRAAYDALLARDTDGEPPDREPDADADDQAADATTAPRAPDIRLDLELSLEEAAFGCDKAVELTRSVACGTCDGTGESGIGRTRFCSACHGSGRVRDRYHGLERCPECDGRGVFSERTCPDCAGSGRGFARVGLQVAVPPGMLAGDDLRLAGQGESGDEGLGPGDLFLRIFLRPHELFELDGRNLSFRMPAGAFKLLAGGEFSVPGLGGRETLVLDPGPPEARTLRLSGRGFPGRGQNGPGDLVIHLEPAWPEKLTDRQRKLLREIDSVCEASLDEALPEVAAWRRRYGV